MGWRHQDTGDRNGISWAFQPVMNLTCFANTLFAKTSVASLLLAAVAAWPQTAAQPQNAVNPVTLLTEAARVNGLYARGLKPWHLRAHWQVLEAHRVTDQGSYEEWWVSDRKYRIAWGGKGFRQTRYMTEKGMVFTGSPSPPGEVAALISDALEVPLPAPAPANLEPSQITREGVVLHCASRGPDLALAPESGRLASAYEACFSGNPPALRLEQGIGIVGEFRSIEEFDGRQIARQATLTRQPGPEVDFTIDTLERLEPVRNAEFTPPAGAAPVEVRVRVSPDVLERYRVPGGLPPSYPAAAKQQHIEGTVVVAVVIREDGTVGGVRAVSGPPALRDAAEAAVASYRYHPYLVNGKPVEVESRVTVPFRLGAR